MTNSGALGSMGTTGGSMMNPADGSTILNENEQPINDTSETAENSDDQVVDETDSEQVVDEEGSGDDEGENFLGFPSFPFPTFFRSFSDSIVGGYRKSRQLYSPCIDRITLPCIVEDFIGAGMGDAPSACVPVLCGNSLCQSGSGSACKIETSVTPFYVGVRFGDGKQNKGSPEDNLGACLRYKQLPCS
jgi:hypothetical protein